METGFASVNSATKFQSFASPWRAGEIPTTHRSLRKPGDRLLREGEAPAEPLSRENVPLGSRLSRSFALPNWLAGTSRLNVDRARLTRAGICDV